MSCVIKDDVDGCRHGSITGTLRDGFYFGCAVDIVWYVNPTLSTGQYYQTAIALADLAHSTSKDDSPRIYHLGPSRDWHGKDGCWAGARRMREAVYVPIIDQTQTSQMMENNPDLIQTIHGTSTLRAIEIAQNGYEGDRSPAAVAKILAECFGEFCPLVYTSANERPSGKDLEDSDERNLPDTAGQV